MGKFYVRFGLNCQIVYYTIILKVKQFKKFKRNVLALAKSKGVLESVSKLCFIICFIKVFFERVSLKDGIIIAHSC